MSTGHRGAALWLQWTVMVTLGESVGFVLPAIVGATTAGLPIGPALLVAAGVVEGTVLGLAQWSVLRGVVPGLRGGAWVAATAAAAAIAYALGLIPSLTAEVWQTWPPAVAVAAGGVVGVLLLLSIGVAQWFVLRRHEPRARSWVWWTAVAWLAGLGVFLLVATPLWYPGQPLADVIAVGAAAGVAMAATVAGITGAAVVRVAARRRLDHPYEVGVS